MAYNRRYPHMPKKNTRGGVFFGRLLSVNRRTPMTNITRILPQFHAIHTVTFTPAVLG